MKIDVEMPPSFHLEPLSQWLEIHFIHWKNTPQPMPDSY